MAKHIRHLRRARKHATKALGAFLRAEKRLTRANDKIVGHVSDIDATIAELSATKAALTEHHVANTMALGQIAKVTQYVSK